MSACDQDLDSEEDLRDEPRLNPALADFGLFEPTSMPDTLAAMNCIDNFTNMVSWYGEECTWRVLRATALLHEWHYPNLAVQP
jgi:hypothetical protein